MRKTRILIFFQQLMNNTLPHHRSVVILAADGQQNLANLNTGACAGGPAKGTTHALLEPISSSTRKHLIDAQNVEGVNSDAQVEGILAGKLDLYSKTRKDIQVKVILTYSYLDNSPCTCWQRYEQPPEPRRKHSPSPKRQGGRSKGTCPHQPSSCRHRKCGSLSQAHRGKSGTWGKPCPWTA